MDVTELLTEAPDGRACHPMTMEDDGLGRHTMTCLDCGREVTFVSATPERVQWYATSHRCGPGRGWQGH